MATIVDTARLLETILASFVTGIGVILVFSIAVWAVARYAEFSRSDRAVAAAAAATVAGLSFLAMLAVVIFGILVMASK